MRNVSACSSTSSVAPQAALVTMALSKVGAATRALVAVLLVFARSYSLQLEVNRKPQSFWLCSPQQPSLGKVVWGALFWPRRQNGWGHDPKIALSCDKSSFKIWATQNSPPPLFRFLTSHFWVGAGGVVCVRIR